MLLDRKAKLTATDPRGDTPLHVAMRARSKTIVEILLRNPKHSQLLYRPNKQGETPYSIDVNSTKTILGQVDFIVLPPKKSSLLMSKANFVIRCLVPAASTLTRTAKRCWATTSTVARSRTSSQSQRFRCRSLSGCTQSEAKLKEMVHIVPQS